MAIIRTQINCLSDTFRKNAEHMLHLVNDFTQKIKIIAQGGSSQAQQRHLRHGKLLARDRLMHLIDPGSFFLELSQLAADNVYQDALPAAGLITGIAKVANQMCMILINDATVKGGTYYPLTVKKHLPSQKISF